MDNNVRSKVIYLIFPPGANDARFVHQLKPLLESISHRIISISYPSRFKSSRIHGFDSIDTIAEYVYKFLKKLLINSDHLDIRIMAFSFGTAVVTRLFQNHSEIQTRFPHSNYKLLLVNAGEFFGEKATYIFKSLFEPALNNKKYLRILRYFVTTFFKFLPRKLYPNSRLLDLNEQWLSTVGYRINMKYKIDIPATVILGTRDLVITPESKEKIKNIFTDSELLFYPGDHIYDYHRLIIYDEALDIMNSWVA